MRNEFGLTEGSLICFEVPFNETTGGENTLKTLVSCVDSNVFVLNRIRPKSWGLRSGEVGLKEKACQI